MFSFFYFIYFISTCSSLYKRYNFLQNVGDGLLQGAGHITRGFVNSVTGLFRAPIKEGYRQGIRGVFTGLAHGVTGIVINPLTGVADAIATVAAGIRNTINNSSYTSRVRYPRYFFANGILFNYNNDIAFAGLLLERAKRQVIEEDVAGFATIRTNEVIFDVALLTTHRLLFVAVSQNADVIDLTIQKRIQLFNLQSAGLTSDNNNILINYINSRNKPKTYTQPISFIEQTRNFTQVINRAILKRKGRKL